MTISFETTRTIKSGNCKLIVSVSDTPNKGYAITNSHDHLHFELHFILSGKVLFSVNDKSIIAGSDETVIIPPSVTHNVEDFEGCERFCITFQIKRINTPDPDMTYENMLSSWNVIKELRVLKKSYTKEINKIMDFAKTNDAFHNASIKHLLALLLLDISNALLPSKSNTTTRVDEIDEQFYCSKIIENCIHLYYQDSNTNITLIADILHLSTKQAERTVKKLTGMSFKQLLLKKRMLIAKELMLTSDKKLYEIAQCVGYNSYEVFYKAFCKYFNTTPTKLKNKLQGKE